MHKTRSSSRSRTRRCVHARAKANARTYDANGNRLTSIQTTGSGTAAQTVKRTYTVDAASNRILSFTQTQLAGTATAGATSNVNYSFDANGSLLRDGLRSYEFDAANRLADVTTGVGIDAPTTRYVHNALGQRLFKTEPLYAPVSSGSNPADPGVMQTLANFFASLWGGSTNTAAPSASEKLGFTYYYDEDGSLLYEQGSGGANSGGSAHYVYLPTPAGPMPIATYTGSKHYAVHTDHLNTPRRLTNSAKQVAWQWAFSAFGDEQPTTARNRYVDPATTPNAGTTTIADVTFNLRYPGQYADKESGLYYNYFRSYDSRTGRYSQSDPIGLQGGWNKFAYAELNPLSITDPMGLMGGGNGAAHRGPGPSVSIFGCMGLACASFGTQDSSTQYSAEITLGGGIEICDPSPPPKPEPQTCAKTDGQATSQPPGIPIPKKYGGAFFGPSIKSDGRFCLRLGPHATVPYSPSFEGASRPRTQ